jgi:small subunit ribosomal protein S17
MAEKKAAPKKKKTEKAPVEETVAEATDVVEEAPVEEPEAVVEEPVVEEAPAEEPVAEAEPEAEPEDVVEEPAVDEPVAEEAPVEEPVAEAEPEAVVEEPVADEPAAEAEPAEAEPAAEAPAAAEPAAPAPQSGPKPKRKHLPRALRPSTKKGRVKREKATERKPIVRIPKPEGEFGRRQERLGTVVSDKGDKTIVVKVDTIKAHRRYKKVIRQSKRFHAHDEQNAAKIGDVVKIIETRPISKTKNWRLAEIIEVAQ